MEAMSVLDMIQDVSLESLGYNITREEALTAWNLLHSLLGEEKARQTIAEVQNKRLAKRKTVEIPSVYTISEKVRQQYANVGIDLVKKVSKNSQPSDVE